MGYKENHSFKAGAWERAAIALRDKHGAYPEKSHLINKADNARKKFRMWRGLREDPDFLYNPASRTVTASEDAWRKHFEVSVIKRCDNFSWAWPWWRMTFPLWDRVQYKCYTAILVQYS